MPITVELGVYINYIYAFSEQTMVSQTSFRLHTFTYVNVLIKIFLLPYLDGHDCNSSVLRCEMSDRSLTSDGQSVTKPYIRSRSRHLPLTNFNEFKRILMDWMIEFGEFSSGTLSHEFSVWYGFVTDCPSEMICHSFFHSVLYRKQQTNRSTSQK